MATVRITIQGVRTDFVVSDKVAERLAGKIRMEDLMAEKREERQRVSGCVCKQCLEGEGYR